MVQTNQINLIQTKTGISPEIALWQERLRIIAFLSLGVFVAAGLFFGAGFFVIRGQVDKLTKERDEFTAAITTYSNRESLLYSLKKQTGNVKKVTDSQKSWAPVVDLASSIVPLPALSTLSVNDKEEVSLSIKTQSIDESLSIINKLMEAARAGQARQPTIDSLQLDKDSGIRLSVTFLPSL